MVFQVSFKSARSVHQQLMDQVRAAVASGALRDGDPLPGIRPLAEELLVNRNTVAKAYAELERQGVIATVVGRGCFVRAGESPLRKDARRKLVAASLDEAVVQAHHLQIDRVDFLRLAEARFDALEDKRQRAGRAGVS